MGRLASLEFAMALPSWYLDEQAHAGAVHLDASYEATYDEKAGAQRLVDPDRLSELGLTAESTLVDLGAGTGLFAAAAAAMCKRVVAADVSEPMVAAIRANALAAGATNLEAVQAGFLSYQHTGEPADFVYVRHAFHQLPDFWKAMALERIASFMRPGGMLWVRDLFFSCEPSEIDDVVEAWLSKAPANSGAGWTRGELDIHLRDEFSTYTWLFEAMLKRAGFEIRETEFTESRIFATFICVRL